MSEGGYLPFCKVLALVHAEAASASTEPVALGSELAAVAVLAVHLSFVFTAVCRVQELSTHS